VNFQAAAFGVGLQRFHGSLVFDDSGEHFDHS
jgi:hypothetical protein